MPGSSPGMTYVFLVIQPRDDTGIVQLADFALTQAQFTRQYLIGVFAQHWRAGMLPFERAELVG